MKKIIAFLALAALMLPGIPAFAAERALTTFTVDVGTKPVTDAVSLSVQITRVATIHHIVISNDDPTVAQTVTFYELADDTNTVSAVYIVDIASTSEYGVPFQTSFPIPASGWEVDRLAVRKSSLVSTVRVTIWYR